MNTEDRGDARYFPSEAETKILVSSLKVYFSHPERSVKRSQVVQDVVKVLGEISTHWNHRNVRLWFNNNKKLLGNSQTQQSSSQNSQSTMFDVPVTIVPRNVFPPPRPASAAVIPPFFDQQMPYEQAYKIPHKQITVPQTIPYVPTKSSSLSVQIEDQKSLVDGAKSIDAYNIADMSLNKAIHASNARKWEELVLPSVTKSIVDQSNLLRPAPEPIHPIEAIQLDPVHASFCSNFCPPIIICDKTLISAESRVDLDISSYAYSVTVNSTDGSIWVYSGSTIHGYSNSLEKISAISTGNHVSKLVAMTFMDDLLLFASGSSITLWNSTGRDENSITFGFSSYLTSVSSCISLKDSIIVGSGDHHTAYLFSNHGQLLQRFTGHCAGITCLAKADDDNIFASGSADQTIRIWDRRTNNPITLMKHDGMVSALASSSDGNLIFSGGSDNIVRVWDIRASACAVNCRTSGTPQSLSFDENTSRISVVTSEIADEKFYIDMIFDDQPTLDGVSQNALLLYQI